MSGPNGDPNISTDNGIIDDEDEFGDEGNVSVHCDLTNWFIYTTTPVFCRLLFIFNYKIA